MDDIRKIRFVYPPILSLFAVAIGYCTGKHFNALQFQKVIESIPDNLLASLGVAAGIASLVLALGFVIGTLSITVLRLVYDGSLGYEEFLNAVQCENVWEYQLNGDLFKINAADYPYISSLFLHNDRLATTHRQWIERRWNAFNLNLHSSVGLFLSWLVGLLYLAAPLPWHLVVISLSLFFISATCYAWIDIKSMSGLLSRMQAQHQVPQK